MRQAGRYLPEYQNLRKTEKDFIKFCLDAEKASEITCQPISRFDMDAAIIFSDILLVLHMLKHNVSFIANEGPTVKKLSVGEKINFQDWDEYKLNLEPVAKAIRITKHTLNYSLPIIGFSGSPWTLFTYLTEGGSSKDFSIARNFLWTDEKNAEDIFNVLVEAIICFLDLQLKAGVNAIMLFDSWAGSIPATFRRKFIIEPTKKIVKYLREQNPSIPIICLPKSMGEGMIKFVDEIEPNCLAVDHLTDIEFIHKSLSKEIVIQGNIDPICLVHGGDRLEREVDHILNLMADRPYIFNLGHGILPNTPVQNVKKIAMEIRGLKKPTPREPYNKKGMAIWAHKSTALACENLMLSLRAYGYDSCPMEGMDSKRIKKLLGLSSPAEISMVISSGKRAENGVYGKQIRFDSNYFIHEI